MMAVQLMAASVTTNKKLLRIESRSESVFVMAPPKKSRGQRD